jgi:hypothetical protein
MVENEQVMRVPAGFERFGFIRSCKYYGLFHNENFQCDSVIERHYKTGLGQSCALFPLLFCDWRQNFEEGITNGPPLRTGLVEKVSSCPGSRIQLLNFSMDVTVCDLERLVLKISLLALLFSRHNVRYAEARALSLRAFKTEDDLAKLQETISKVSPLRHTSHPASHPEGGLARLVECMGPFL